MKIIHTADWHIGKKLHKFEMNEDFELFISWLTELIKERKVELLLISGDVFDLSNPSAESARQYYRALIALKKLDCKIIITGGNHDSAAMLNAPKLLLNALDIHVIGGMDEEMKTHIIPVTKNGKTELIVAAIPFLRDADLRKANEGKTYEDRLEIVQMGIENMYRHAYDFCTSNHKDIPVIAMGHLYTAGATSSDSEREIQIGNRAMFNAARFGSDFSYLALGHIHKPQRISHSKPVFYSGSPYPLSFSEREDRKRILFIDTDNGFEPESIEIPAFRKLIRISGTLEEIELKLMQLHEKLQLTSLIEIEMLEEKYNAERALQLEKLINEFDKEGFEIIHRTIHSKTQLSGTGDLYDKKQLLSELNPSEIFEKMLQNRDYEENTMKELKELFQMVVEEVQQENNCS